MKDHQERFNKREKCIFVFIWLAWPLGMIYLIYRVIRHFT